jgi:UDP-glucose 6-dehydrogenase
MREAPAVVIINELLSLGAKVSAYVPARNTKMQILFTRWIEYRDDPV